MIQNAKLAITTLFESSEGDLETLQNYHGLILRTLKKILPSEFFEEKESPQETILHRQKLLQEVIPLITCSDARNFPGPLSFFAFSKTRSNSFKFFFEMISRWLCPGERLNVVLVCAYDFKLPELSDEIFSICEVMIGVDHQAQFEEIQRHFPIICSEIALGIQSEFYAQRLLEIKGLAADDKTAMIQGFIAMLVKRFPSAYDRDIFTEMQHILVTCRDDFKNVRQARHLSRMISIQYLFRKALREAIKKNNQRRHLQLKIFRSFLHTPEGRKKVLSILVGLNFVRDHESFGQEHLLRAVNQYVSSAMPVENSFFMHKSEDICIGYLELEKKDGSDFSMVEMRKLRRDLPGLLKNRIEYKLHPVFMPRNEEEIMRNMLSLTSQIKYLRDIPQVIISFDEQTYSHLFFTVIMARILKDGSLSISEMFKKSDSSISYVHDRTKVMGYLRKKYPKEATVFRLRIPKSHYLRADHTIDLYKARQKVEAELSLVVGEIRDYNGGMISKERELFLEVKRELSEIKDYDEWLLENFFYSLSPLAVRALLDPSAFKNLFIMLLEGNREFKQEGGYYLKFIDEESLSYALIISEDFSLKNLFNQSLQELQIPATDLAHAYTKVHGNACLGYICSSRNASLRKKFQQIIESTLAERFTLT